MLEYHANIIVGLVIFSFDDKEPLNFSVGMIRDNENKLVLPNLVWRGTSTIEATARHLLKKMIYVDETWVNMEEVGVIELEYDPEPQIMCVWKIYIPNTIQTNKQIEWIQYGRLEDISGRITRSHLKALRRAFNR